MKNQTLEFFYDYVSPYTYLANSQLALLQQRTNCTINYRPFLLGALFKETNNHPPLTVVAKQKYMLTDLHRWSQYYDVPFNMNPNFPVNTVKYLRGALIALENNFFHAYHHALFNAMWRDGINLNDISVVNDVLHKSGIEGEQIWQQCQQQSIKDQLKANTDEAVKRGAFGSPTFFIGDQMFFGNDRLFLVEIELQKPF